MLAGDECRERRVDGGYQYEDHFIILCMVKNFFIICEMNHDGPILGSPW